MVKKLTKLGNSQALVIDKPILEALGIDAETPLQLTVSGNSLIIAPVDVGLGPEEVARSIERLRPRYAQMLRRLAE